MAIQSLELGTAPDDGTGDSLRVGGDKINDNFVEIYTALGDGDALSSGISASASVISLVAPNLSGVVAGTQTSATITTLSATTGINSGSTITLDATTDIILDADGGDIFFKDAGTTFGSATNTSGNLIIKSGTTTAATFAGANVTLAGTLGVGAITTTGAFKGADGYTIGNASVAAVMTLASTGIVTFADDIIIKDAGTIGSASDPDAIAIGADGDVTLTQDLELQHDGAILSFGTNDEVTLTHVHDTGILLNSTNVIQFNDASQNIGAPSNAILDINATDEIELNATLVDINANVEISGTATTTGVHTFTAVPLFPNNTIETADIQADAITGAKIADDAINSEHYTDASIDAAHFSLAGLQAPHQLDATPPTDHTATGPQTNTLNAGYGCAAFDLVILGSSSTWLEADADATGTSINMLGVTLAAASSGAAVNVALPGSFIRDDTFNFTPGAPLYISGTLGAMTHTKPTGSGDIVRVVGFALNADVVFFQPSSDFIVLA